MRHPHPVLASAAGLVLLAGCAGGIALHESSEQVRERYSAYAGEPIDHFNWLGRYDGWESLGPRELVLFTTPSDAYLIKVGPPCDRLQFAQHIGLSSTGGSVYSRLDSVTSEGWRCPIDEIRKVDYRRMRADMRLDAQKAKAAAAASK